MRVPINWLKDYISIEKSPQEIANSFTSLGLMLDKPIENEVLDLEQRLNRADLLSILGCARDLAAFERLKLTLPKKHIKKGKKISAKYKVEIKVECQDAVNRFNTRIFKNIKVKPSPKWLSSRLKAYGIPPINNIVDITNFVMVELGQPMHAQDLAKFNKREIVIRYALKGEKIVTLLGETVKLDEKTFVLTQDNIPIAIGGIVGGKATGITNDTTEIILDAGNYDQNQIRKTSRRLKIANETVLRYDKFLHPLLTEVALKRATQLILEIAGGQYYENQDWYPKVAKLKTMKLRLKRIHKLSGMDISLTSINKTLKLLGYETIEQSPTTLTLEVPYWRTDIEVEDDLVSDILRIQGYDKIPLSLLSGTPPKEITPEIYRFEDRIRDILTALGANEHITEPLVPKKGIKTEVKLENALTQEKSALRTDVLDTLSLVVPNYFKRGRTLAFIFEIGKSYHKPKSGFKLTSFKERNEVSVIYHNTNLTLQQNSEKLISILATILKNLGTKKPQIRKLDSVMTIYIDKVIVGELKRDRFSLYHNELLTLSGPIHNVISEFTHPQIEDISLIVKKDQHFGEVYTFIDSFSKDIIDTEVIENRIDAKLGRTVLIRLHLKENSNSQAIKKDLLSKLQKKFNIKPRKI